MTTTTPRFEAEAFLRRLWAMDRALVAAGFPATSPWWRAETERFVRALALGARRWVIRAGRRAGKSTTLARLAVAWAWFGQWSVPLGDVAVIPFVSVSKDEAGARLRTIAAVCTALWLRFEVRGDDLELLADRAVVFRVLACTTTAVVGFTSIAVFGDEVARWEARDTSANPAREVIGSLAPTLATLPHGFMCLCSSPWSTDDYHAELFEQGDTAGQCVSFAATWSANPTITEARTRELEPDPRIWSREYAAEPGSTVSAALDTADVAGCFGRLPSAPLTHAFVAIDASSLRGDVFAYVTGGASAEGELVVRGAAGWEGDAQRHVSMASIVEHIAEHAKRIGAGVVYGDQREEAALRSLFAQHRIALRSYAWSEPSKDEAMQLLRRLMRERRVILPEHEQLRRELTGMKARLTPSGRIRYESGGLDYASCLVTLAHAIVAHDFRLGGDAAPQLMSRPRAGSPLQRLRAEPQWRPIHMRERSGDPSIFGGGAKGPMG